MASELFKLLGTIAIDTSGADGSIDSFKSKFQSLGDKVSKIGSNISNVGVTLTKTVTAGATLAGGAVYAFANKTASAADEVDKMSQKIGVSREAYQELSFICSQSGMSVETLQTGMKTLTAAMDGAASGTKSNVEQFKKLGISVLDSSGNLRSQEEVMWETLTALNNMENQTEKARLATELFGRSGTELMPLLNGASGSIEEMKNQAHDLGLIMSDTAVDAGVEYTDTMDQLKRAFSAAALSAGSELLPYLTQFAKWLIDEGIPKVKAFAEKIGDLFKWFSNLDDKTKKLIATIAGIVVAMGPVLTVAGKIISLIGSVIKIGGTLTKGIGSVIKIGGVLSGGMGTIATFVSSTLIPAITAIGPVLLAVTAGIAAVIAIGVLLYKNWDEIKEAAGKAWEGIKNAVVDGAKAVGTAFNNCINGIKEFGSNLVSGFKEIKEKTSEHIEEMKEKAAEKVSEMKEKITEGFHNLKEGAVEKIKDLKEKWGSKFDEAKEKISDSCTKIKENVVSRFEDLRSNAVSKLSEVADKGVAGFNTIKEKGSAAISSLKEHAASRFQEMGNTIFTNFSGYADKISSTFSGVKDTVGNIVEKVKDFFKFDWKLPDIKLPHFKIEWETDGFIAKAMQAIGLQGLPKLNVEWYAKAMNNPMIMNSPTAFGINASGQIMAGGEKGSEVVSGTNTLMQMISEAVSANNNVIYGTLDKILAIISQYIPEMAQKQILLDSGELVGALAAPMNEELGRITYMRGRRN